MMGVLQYCNTVTLTLALISTTVVIGRTTNVTNPETTEAPRQLCTTEICQQAGNTLIENLNVTIKPCDNFYEHACGGWIAKNPLRESQLSLNQRDLMEAKARQELKELLEKTEKINTKTVKKAQDFYQSCVNEDAISSRGIAPIVSMVSSNGGWPLTQQSKQLNENLTLQDIYENYVSIGDYWPLLGIKITPNERFGEQKSLMVQWEIPPSKSWQAFRIKARDSKLKTYKSYVKSVIQKFIKSGQFNVSPTDLATDINDMIAFEYKLWTTIVLSNGARNNASTIADLQKKWNSGVIGHPELKIDWLELIRSSFSETGIEIDENEKILLYPRDNIVAVASLLKKTPIRTIVNYIHWYVIYDALTFTNVQKRMFDDGEVNQRPNSCFVQPELAHAYSYIYVRKNVNNKTLNIANSIVSQTQAEIKRLFNESTLLNDNEKLVVDKTVDEIRNIIGYPNWYDEPGKIDEYYKELTIGSNYFENALNIRRFNEIKTRQSLREPYVEQEISCTTVYPKYNVDDNSLVFPANLFQLPLFHPEIPMSINYGSMGVLTGREIASAFLYDDVIENSQHVPGLSASTTTEFKKKNSCFVDQYNKYTLTDYNNKTINVYGEGTLQNHVADNIGIKLALKAYLSQKIEKNLDDVKIPALADYSDEQLFFYSVANLLCAAYDPNYVANNLSTVFRVRVNGALSNLNEFAQAFNCPSGSPMNPDNKCSLLE